MTGAAGGSPRWFAALACAPAGLASPLAPVDGGRGGARGRRRRRLALVLAVIPAAAARPDRRRAARLAGRWSPWRGAVAGLSRRLGAAARRSTPARSAGGRDPGEVERLRRRRPAPAPGEVRVRLETPARAAAGRGARARARPRGRRGSAASGRWPARRRLRARLPRSARESDRSSRPTRSSRPAERGAARGRPRRGSERRAEDGARRRDAAARRGAGCAASSSARTTASIRRRVDRLQALRARPPARRLGSERGPARAARRRRCWPCSGFRCAPGSCWTCALIAVYVLVTGAGPSIQRAGVMGAAGARRHTCRAARDHGPTRSCSPPPPPWLSTRGPAPIRAGS